MCYITCVCVHVERGGEPALSSPSSDSCPA